MTDAHLFAWAVCNGWEARRGARMVTLTEPGGRAHDVPLDSEDMPVLDSWLRARIRGAQESARRSW